MITTCATAAVTANDTLRDIRVFIAVTEALSLSRMWALFFFLPFHHSYPYTQPHLLAPSILCTSDTDTYPRTPPRVLHAHILIHILIHIHTYTHARMHASIHTIHTQTRERQQRDVRQHTEHTALRYIHSDRQTLPYTHTYTYTHTNVSPMQSRRCNTM